MSQQWYISKSGAQEGPFTPSQLKELVIAKEVTQDTFVWANGMAEWTPAGNVNGLFHVIPPPVAIVPPSNPLLDLNTLHVSTAPQIRNRSLARKQTNLYFLTCVCIALPIAAVGLAMFGITGLDYEGMGNAFSIQSTSMLTKEQFRAKFADLDGGSRSRGYVRELDLIQALGKPSRTQTVEHKSFWYWTCRDGIVQIVIFGYKEPMVESQVGEGRIVVEQINDY